MLEFLKKKPKEILDCLGYFDCKPYDFFENNLIYTNDILIEKNENISVYTRLYKGTIFVFTLVHQEAGFKKTDFNYEALKDKIDAVIKEAHKAVINLIIFKNKNDATIAIAKEPVKNTKKEFNQTLIYDYKKVRLAYYRPVPDFYKLYDHYVEAMFYDLAAITPKR